MVGETKGIKGRSGKSGIFTPAISISAQTLRNVERSVYDPGANWPRLYLWLLICFAFAIQLADPIVYGDSDMWYHLAGGRRFWDTGEIPLTGYFSFIAENRNWVNYYWGFQAAIAPVFDEFGYQGLVVVRTILFTATLFIVVKLIGGFANYSVAAALLAAAVYMVLETRGYQLRPHLISYFMIALFIFVLEHHRRYVFALPLFTIVWVNMHGIEWVIGALICGAYTIEIIIDRWRRNSHTQRFPLSQIAAIIACAVTLFMNPHGWRILLVPFAPSPDIPLFINEMEPLQAHDYYSIFFVGARPLGNSIFAVLFLFSLFAVVRSLQEGKFRLAHFILWVGATYLITQGARFAVEWVLLATPLLATLFRSFKYSSNQGDCLSVPTIIIVAVLIAPSTSFSWTNVKNRSYPFDDDGLPVGSTDFLQQLGAGGRLLSLNPTNGGYLNFRLYPGFQLYADMQVPPFTGQDHYRLFEASRDTSVLERLIKEYSPDFVALPLNVKIKDELTTLSDLVPIFFDDAQVLYANRIQHPGVAEKYRIRAVDPFDLNKGSEDLVSRIAELRRLHALDPSGVRVNNGLAALLLQDERYMEARDFAAQHVKLAPMDPNAHLLLGSSLEYLGRCDEAITHFKKALKFADEEVAREVNLHLGNCYYTLRDFDSAYRTFRVSVNPFMHDEYPETLYQFAVSSLAAGDIDRAQRLVSALIFKEGESESVVVKRAQSLSKNITAGEFDGLGLIALLKSTLGLVKANHE